MKIDVKFNRYPIKIIFFTNLKCVFHTEQFKKFVLELSATDTPRTYVWTKGLQNNNTVHNLNQVSR